MGGKGVIQGVSAVRAFTMLLACAPVPLGSEGKPCLAIDLLPTLRGLSDLLFNGRSVEHFVASMWKEMQQDPAERLLSRATRDGLAFVPSLLTPTGESAEPSAIGVRKMPEPFLSDDKLASMGIDVESMDRFRKSYLAFRAGDSFGAAGEFSRKSSGS